MRQRIRNRVIPLLPDRLIGSGRVHSIRWEFLVGGIILIGIIIGLNEYYSLGVFIFIDKFIALGVGWANTNQGALSVLLSGLLVVLYFMQHRTQTRQSEIMERQENWMKTNHSPDIFINRWWANDDSVSFELINAGNGLAKDFRVRVKIWTGKHAGSYSLVESNIPGIQLPNEIIPDPSFYSVSYMRRNDANAEITASLLEPSSAPSAFSTDIGFVMGTEDNDNERSQFKEPMARLFKDGVERISFTVELIYADFMNETTTQVPWAGDLKLEEDITFSDALEKCERNLSGHMDHVKPMSRTE